MSFEFVVRRNEPFLDGDIKVPHVQIAFTVKGWEESWSEDMSEYMDLSGIVSEEKACVILAAPDLLEALTLAAQSAGFQYMIAETRAKIEGAIAKAEGRS